MAFNVERKALERDVTSALLLNGYSQVKRDKFLKRIGQETDVFVYPGVGSKSTILELQPVVGFENVTLRSRLQAVGKKDGDLRVGHILIGEVPEVRKLWDGNFTLWTPKGQTTAPMIELFMTAMEAIICPRFAVYDSLEKVIDLLERYVASFESRDLTVADAHEKLALLRAG
jgi:hypothetical protein